MEKKCQGCETDITERVAEYSAKHYKKELCMSCQKVVREEQQNAKEAEKDSSEPLNVEEETISEKPLESVTKPKLPEKPKSHIPGYIIKIQGKEYITHAGLLDIAHHTGLTKIETELISNNKDNNDEIVFKATVYLGDRYFSAHGDATSTNVNSNIKAHKLRMAETRAVNRALRFATNIGMCSFEELEGDLENGS